MVERKDMNKIHERLDKVTGTYGADMSRWPEDDVRDLRHVIDVDARARALMDESAALDQLLMRAPSLSPSTDLAARIMASATGESEAAGAGVNEPASSMVFAFGGGSAGDLSDSVLPAFSISQILPVASVLTASLAIGLYIGMTGFGLQNEPATMQVVGLYSAPSGDTYSDSDIGALMPSISFEDGVVPSEDL